MTAATCAGPDSVRFERHSLLRVAAGPYDDSMASMMSAPRSSRIALSYRNYRRFWVAEVFFVVAAYVQSIGFSALIVGELDAFPWGLAWVGLASAIPVIVLSIPGGSLADRLEPYRLVVGSRLLMLLGLGVLVLLSLTGVVELWMAIVWSAANGVLAAVAIPAAHTLLPRLIDHTAMPSAVALISSITSAVGTVVPIAMWASFSQLDREGAWWVAVFLLEGSYAAWALLVAATISVASFLVLLTIRVPARDSAERGGEEGGNESKSVMAGIRFVFGHPVFLAAIGLSFATSVFGVRSIGLLGVFVADLPGVGPRVVLLSALAGGGGLAAALWVVRRGIGSRPGVLMLASAAIYGVLIAAFVATVSIAPAFVLPLLLVVGFASQLHLIIGTTVMQLLVPDRLRGRVMGVWVMTISLTYVGGIIALIAARFIGLRVTMAAGALVVAAFAVAIYAASAELRRLRGEDVRPPTEPAAASPPAA